MLENAASSLRYRLGQVYGLAKTETAKNSAIIFGGNFFNAALSMVAVILLSRLLGPADFGVLAIFNTILNMVVGLTDLGLGTTAVRYISKYLEEDKRKAAVVMRVIFKIEISLGLIIALIGLVFSRPIASLLGGEHLVMAVRLSFLASIFQSMAAFYGPFFIAYRKFLTSALVGIFGVGVRVAAVITLVILGALNLENTLWVYTAAPIIFFVFGFLFVPKDFLIKARKDEERQAFREIAHFSKWVFLSYIATTIAGRLDVLLISRFKGSEAVGLYAAALQLATVMPLLIGAVTTVLLPKASTLRGKREYLSYIKKVTLGSIALVLFLLPILVLGDELIKWIFGDRFLGSTGAFKLIFIGYLAALIANPLSQLLYAMGKPKVFTFLNFTQLLISLSLNLYLIPLLGIIGAAMSFMVINIFGSIVATTYLIKTVSSMDDTTQAQKAENK